ncbi:MAG: hypothetical protein D3909_03030, partial [Candidatus Electrothrix sp. ATG1]|nr:hypothetical protein [Candidatus Electrothrix sp. ATG1]
MASENAKSKFDVFIEEKYIPLDQKIKVAIAVVIVLALIAGAYFFVFDPNLKKITQLEEKKSSLQADVDKAEKAAKNLAQHEKELKEVEKKFEEIS